MSKSNVPVNISNYLPPGSSVPDVYTKDSDLVTTSNQITNTSILVDVGNSPNSNTGDPLRLAFVKFNNLAEAVFQQSIGLQAKFDNYDSDLYTGGSFVIDGGYY